MRPSRKLLGFFALSLSCAWLLILERRVRERYAFADHPELLDNSRQQFIYRMIY